jgi:hypothetical protein
LDKTNVDVANQNLAGKSLTLPPKLDIKSIEWDELDDLLQVFFFSHCVLVLFAYLNHIDNIAGREAG